MSNPQSEKAVPDREQPFNKSSSLSAKPCFFLVVNPGFERLALYELTRVLKQMPPSFLKPEDLENIEPQMHAGGIELLLPMAVGLSLNQSLRIPTRILLRLGVQKELLLYQDFQRWVRTLKIEKYFPLRDVSVSSRSSKIKMKEKLKKVFLNTYPYTPNPQGSDLYIRVFRDECTVSVDTSGEDLYQRGQQKWVGEAPIRETMAASLLQLASQGIDSIKEWQLVDPMMGSGTLLLEGLQMGEPLVRSFAYQNWFKKEIPQISKGQNFEHVWGADLLDKNLDIVQKNIQAFKSADIQLRQEDLFNGKKESTNLKRLVIVNPPYGKRLKIKRENFYTDLIATIAERFSPERIGVIIPRGQVFQKPATYEQVRYLEFSNNSIDVHFHLLLK